MLEQLYSDKWLANKSGFSFLLGFAYAILGIGSAIIVFPHDPALPAVAFTSLLLLPSLNRMLSIEEKQAAGETKFSLFNPFRDHLDIFGVYFFSFLGIMAAFSFFSLILPDISTSQLFHEQISIIGPAGNAVAPHGSFSGLVANNFLVFIFIFLASFIYGAGSIFVIVWNASVWGVVIATIARNAANAVGNNPFAYFAATILSAFPHMFLEAGAYFMATISGAVIGQAVLTEKIFSERFTKAVKDALTLFGIAVIILILGAYVESHLTGRIFRLFA